MENNSLKRCQARTRSNKSCGAYATASSNFCFTHDPKRRRERAAAHKLGGRNRRRTFSDQPFPDCDVKTAQGLEEFLAILMRETWKLENSLARSRTLCYLAATQKSILEVGEFEERITNLEDTINLMNRK